MQTLTERFPFISKIQPILGKTMDNGASTYLEKSVQTAKDCLSPNKSRWPYDVEIISNTSEDEQELRREEMLALTEGKVGPNNLYLPEKKRYGVMVLSVIEANWPGGAGNLLGTFNAYIEACKKANELYGVNLDGLFKDGKVKIRHIPNGGRAKRCNGLNQAEHSSRASLRMFGDVQTKKGVIPLTLFGLVAATHAALAESNDGRYIDVIYAGQIALASRDVWTAGHPEAMIVKFGQKLEGDEAVNETNLKDLGVYEADKDGIIKLSRPKGSFKDNDGNISVAEAKTWLQSHQGQYSYGSHRLHRDFVFNYMAFYSQMLSTPVEQGGRNINREPPDFIKPMTMVLAIPEAERTPQRLQSEVVDTATDDTERAKRQEVVGFYLQHKDTMPDDRWIGIYDMGADVYWDRFRRPL